jgi:hypothetical protein
MYMKKIGMMMAMAVLAVGAFADVSVNINVTSMGLTDQNDATISVADGFYMLVADVDGDGLDGWNFDTDQISFSDSLVLDDDVVLYQGGYSFDDAALSPNSQESYLGVIGGEQYYVIWGSVGSSATALGEGNWFGAYSIDDNVIWEVPATGTVAPFISDANAVAVSSLYGYAQSVPEPASALLVLLGGGMVYALRRRGNKFV